MKTPLRELLKRMDRELVVAELAAWAAFHHDRLPAQDKDRTLLAIRRLDAIRRTINERL